MNYVTIQREFNGIDSVITLAGSSGGGGTVTNVSSGNLSPLFTVSIATATSTPTFTFSAVNQAKNIVYAGPASGSNAAPTFRSLVAADVPDLSGTYATLAGGNTFTGSNEFTVETKFTEHVQIIPVNPGNNGDDTPGYDGVNTIIAAESGGDAGANPTTPNAGGNAANLVLKMGAGGAGAGGGSNGTDGRISIQDARGSEMAAVDISGSATFNTVTASSFIGALAGNASTASSAAKLTTPRTIGGSSFDGSANVTSFPSPGAIGGTTPAAATFTTVTIGSATSLLLGTAGSAVGSVGFRNATSGTATVAPPTGALGTYTVTLPNAASTLPIFGQQITFSGPTAARTVTLPDANFTVARTDAANTFTGTQTFGATVATSMKGTGTLYITGNTGSGVADSTPVVFLGSAKYGRYWTINNEGYLSCPASGGFDLTSVQCVWSTASLGYAYLDGNVWASNGGNTILLRASMSSGDAVRINGTAFSAQLTASSGTQNWVNIAPVINQSSTAAYNALLVNVTETATGSGNRNLIDLQTGGTSRFRVNSAGTATLNGGPLNVATLAAAPSTPPSGYVSVYCLTADGGTKLYSKDSGGTVRSVTLA